MAFTLSSDRVRKFDELAAKYPSRRAACIPLLHLCQEQEGWASPEVIAFVAEALDMPTSAVKGVSTFYTSLHDQPVGKHVVWICRTVACELRGAKRIQEAVEQHLGCKQGETSADGCFTLKKAECLAGCGYGPVLQIDEKYFENLETEDLPLLLDKVRSGEIDTRVKLDDPSGAAKFPREIA